MPLVSPIAIISALSTVFSGL